jgi:hypothetical protein
VRLRAVPQTRALALLRSFTEFQATPLDAEWLQVVVDDVHTPQLVRALATAGVDVYEVQRHRLTLEELFFDLTEPAAKHAVQAEHAR